MLGVDRRGNSQPRGRYGKHYARELGESDLAHGIVCKRSDAALVVWRRVYGRIPKGPNGTPLESPRVQRDACVSGRITCGC